MTQQAGERIVLTRWSPVTAAVVLLVTGIFAAGPILALLNADTAGERVFLVMLSFTFGAPFLWSVWRAPKAVRGMGITVDCTGIHEFDGGNADTVAWSDIERVGFGAYSRPYRGIKTRSTPAFEVYRRGRQEPEIRCTLSPYGGDAERIEQAVRRFHPDLWAGPFLHER